MAVNKPPQPQSSQLGRDALLIHGLALVFAAETVGTGVWLGMEGEFLPAVAVGAVATFVLFIWSADLAVRALLLGQSATWPAVVFALWGLEASAACILILVLDMQGQLWVERTESLHGLFRLVFALGLPVFLPVFVLAGLLGVAVASWRVRRAEKRDLNAGAAPWPRQRCLKRGVTWFAAVTALAVALMLPCPLFLYCLYTNGAYLAGSFDWQVWVKEHTPAAVGEASASILSPLKGETAKELYLRTLYSGRITQARPLTDLSSTNIKRRLCAYNVMVNLNRKAALDFETVTRLADGKVRGAIGPILSGAGAALGRSGNTERIRLFLNPARGPQPRYEFLDGLIESAFDGRHRLELLPDLERFCQVDSPVRQWAMHVLAGCAAPEELKRIWAGFLADTDPLRRAPAIRTMGQIRDMEVKLEIIFAVLDRQDKVLQREVLIGLYDEWSLFNADQKELVRLVKFVLPLLEDKDLGLRRAATWIASGTARQDMALRQPCYTLNKETAFSPDGAAPPDTPEEQELVKKVREAAVKWLQENDK